MEGHWEDGRRRRRGCRLSGRPRGRPRPHAGGDGAAGLCLQLRAPSGGDRNLTRLATVATYRAGADKGSGLYTVPGRAVFDVSSIIAFGAAFALPPPR